MHWPEMTASELGAERMAEGMRAFEAYLQSLHDAGVLVSGDVLQPTSSSTTVTLTSRTMQIQHGPYANTKEQIGGLFVLDVPDLDAAISWAGRCPAAQWGTVEVRPSAQQAVDGEWVSAG